MTTEAIAFEVSQELLASMKVGSAELVEDIRRLAAIAYFRSKKLSLGKAAELTGMPHLDFMGLLANQGIVVFDYDESMLKEELLGVAELKSVPRQGVYCSQRFIDAVLREVGE